MLPHIKLKKRVGWGADRPLAAFQTWEDLGSHTRATRARGTMKYSWHLCNGHKTYLVTVEMRRIGGSGLDSYFNAHQLQDCKSPEESTVVIPVVSFHFGLSLWFGFIIYLILCICREITYFMIPLSENCHMISHGFSGIARVFSLNVPRFEFWLFKEVCCDPLVMSSKTALWCRIRNKQWDCHGLSFLYRRGLVEQVVFFPWDTCIHSLKQEWLCAGTR